MKYPEPQYRSSLYPSPLGRMQAKPMNVEATKRQGWCEQHILVVSQDDVRLNPMERQLIRSIGERLYGQSHTALKGGQHG
jgi:hypothetical protein